MPDTQFIAVILLLVVAVIAGYFYLKRAQRRDLREVKQSADPEATTPEPSQDSADRS